jgi:PTS system ascorbate-specific IIA component
VPLASAFGSNSISLHHETSDFESAVSLAVQNLVADKRALPEYLDEVLGNLKTLGPYFVIAPGIALAHAKPSASVLEVGFSLARFEQPLWSGSSNDPVSLVFAFCAVDSSSHIELLGEFANWLSTPGIVNFLQNASAESVIRSLL